MSNRAEDAPDWARAVAAELESYLRAAAALPAPAPPVVDPDLPSGWYSTPPGGSVEGRTPWIHMSDIHVDCIGATFVLTFTWRQDESPNVPRYLLPMTAMRADAITGSEALLTRLDFFLDTSWRSRNTVDLGHGVTLVVMAK
ncbi:hypothetical protein ACTD5D_21430 [Nocardia takedensis]|uniref:hypothetical protein n=1 Tax=Nocardia takedensis TaxID=259390 RepID=UPI003F76BA49